MLIAMFVLWLVDPKQALLIVRFTGYYFILITSLGFVAYLIQASLSGVFNGISAKDLKIGVCAVMLGSWFLFVHADFDYKIAMDDYLLAGTAKQMHESREVARADFGRHMGNTFIPITLEVDKRPWFYPFIIASLHDLTGYREANPFIVNAVAGIVFLAGVYLFGYLLAGRMAGICAVLLWVTSPLLAQNATGAGMEMLNLLMLQILFLLATYYLRKPSRILEGALSLSAVLLTYTRYESGLLLVPVLIVILLGWWREKKILLAWGSVCASLLLLGVMLQTRIYAVTEASWELSAGAIAPFSLSALLENFPHALHFFFSADASLANSLLLSMFGLPAILAFFVMLRTEAVKYWKSNPAGLMTALFGLFLIVHLLIVLSFHASKLDSLFVSRYALPFHWLLVFALLALLAYIAEKRPAIWRVAIALTLFFTLIVTLPKNAKAIFSNKNFIVREYNWLELLSENTIDSKSLVIDQFTASWALREWAVLEPHVALLSAERIAAEIQSGQYPAAYFVERMHYQDDAFVPNYPVFAELHETFVMELIEERSFRPFELTRLYRLAGYRAPQ
jgi:4-amino-4-deoxy-L-arabinose transferase-like glycosyltransferase